MEPFRFPGPGRDLFGGNRMVIRPFEPVTVNPVIPPTETYGYDALAPIQFPKPQAQPSALPAPRMWEEGPPGSASGGGLSRTDRILNSIAGPESRNNPNAVNGQGSSAKGLFQMIDSTWGSFLKSGGHNFTDADRMNPDAQRAAAGWYLGEIDKTLGAKLGRQPSDNEARLAWALGPGGAGAFLTADPNADAFEAYSKVAGRDIAEKAFRQNGSLMRPGMTVGQVVQAWNGHFSNQPRGPGVAGGTSASTPQAGEMPPGEKGAPPPNVNDPYSPMSVIQQEPGNDGMFSSMNLLRMAAAAAGGKNLNESLGGMLGAIPKGMQEDKLMQMKQQQLQTNAVGEAAKLMELGMNPAVAMDLATGKMSREQAAQALQGVTLQAKGRGSQNAGIFYDESGNAYGMTFNPQSGKYERQALPPGLVRAEDGMMRHLAKGDAEAYQAATTRAGASQQRLGQMSAAMDILNSGKVTPGPNFTDQLKTSLANRFGLGPNDPTSQQMLTNIFADLNVAAMDKFKGLGPMSDADRAALEKAGPNWQMDSNALRIMFKYQMRNIQHENKALDAWQSASPEERRNGFQSFLYNWKKSNPLQPMQVLGEQTSPQPSMTGADQFWRN